MGRITSHLDPLGRVTMYLNDPAGDRLRTRIEEAGRREVAADVEAKGEWSRVGDYQGTRYRFDRAGNLVEKGDGKSTLKLFWDANQRLVESHRDGVRTCYGYDPLGRRLFKETGDRRTLFYWDGDAMVWESQVVVAPKDETPEETATRAQERDKLRAILPDRTKEYVYYPETFEPLALINGSDNGKQVYHYHNDPNGCPTRVTDRDGKVAWAARYDAWGGVVDLPVNQLGQQLRLQGQYEDAETGLYYNRYRYYSPSLGLYATQDPLGLGAADHLYWYARNVFQWIDPLGLTCKIQEIHPDTFTKGVHIDASNGIELMVRPGKDGKVLFKQVFSNADPKAVQAAIKEATKDLANPRWVAKLKDTADRATKHLAENGAPAKSAETRFLSKALEKIL